MATLRPKQLFGDIEVHTLTVGLHKANCYLLIHAEKKDAIVVDPGFEPDCIREQLAAAGATPSRILLTHGHFDHVGAVDALVESYGVPCLCDAREARLVRQASTYAFRFGRTSLRPPQKVTFIDTLQPLNWHGHTIHALPTPGHTQGSLSFSVGELCIFSGDTLFREAVGPSHYPESNSAQLIESVDLLVEGMAQSAAIFPGHGKPWSAPEAKAWWKTHRCNPPSFSLFGHPVRNDDSAAEQNVEPGI